MIPWIVCFGVLIALVIMYCVAYKDGYNQGYLDGGRSNERRITEQQVNEAKKVRIK